MGLEPRGFRLQPEEPAPRVIFRLKAEATAARFVEADLQSAWALRESRSDVAGCHHPGPAEAGPDESLVRSENLNVSACHRIVPDPHRPTEHGRDSLRTAATRGFCLARPGPGVAPRNGARFVDDVAECSTGWKTPRKESSQSSQLRTSSGAACLLPNVERKQPREMRAIDFTRAAGRFMPRPFKGVIDLDIRRSKPDWDALLDAKAPKDAPNVLVILYDDT